MSQRVQPIFAANTCVGFTERRTYRDAIIGGTFVVYLYWLNRDDLSFQEHNPGDITCVMCRLFWSPIRSSRGQPRAALACDARGFEDMLLEEDEEEAPILQYGPDDPIGPAPLLLEYPGQEE